MLLQSYNCRCVFADDQQKFAHKRTKCEYCCFQRRKRKLSSQTKPLEVKKTASLKALEMLEKENDSLKLEKLQKIKTI